MGRLAATVVAVASLVLPSAAAPAENPPLDATVGQGDGFNIALRDASGAFVQHLDPGTYTVQVHDLSEIHNFHLFGPGVDQSTPVASTAEVTWTVTFTNGTYTYQCDPHAGVMRGTFTVGTVASLPPVARLRASVGPGRRISLRTADGARATVVSGTRHAVVTVLDRSRKDNFRLRGPRVNKATGIHFRGRVTWLLTLRPGAYTYRSDAHRRLRGTFTVTASASPA